MGAPKQKWTAEEEDALRAGVAKHGTGKWKHIQKDPEFNTCLAARSNIDLKDKWRNMSVSASGQCSRDKVRTPKLKALPAPLSTPHAPSSTPASQDATTDTVMDTSKSPQEGKTAPKYNQIISEALEALNEPGGSDVSAIIGYIEQRMEVPQNFRRTLTSRLRRFVSSGKLDKVDNCYKLKKDVTFGTRTPTPKLKESRQPSGKFGSTIEDAAVTAAAYKLADAENKSFMSATAVKEVETVIRKSEYSDSFLQLAREILEKCSRGEVVRVA